MQADQASYKTTVVANRLNFSNPKAEESSLVNAATIPDQVPAIHSYVNDTSDPYLVRYLASQSSITPQHQVNQNYRYPGSRTTSMLVSGNSEGTRHSYDNLLDLTIATSRKNSSVASSVNARAEEAQQSPDGVLQVPPLPERRILECPFNLAFFCLMSFFNEDDWINHSLTHFCTNEKTVQPPTRNKCCFCEKEFYSSRPFQSWAERMHHVSLHHRRGHRLAHARPDFALFKYLFDNRLISDDEYRDLQGNSHRRLQRAISYSKPQISPESVEGLRPAPPVFAEYYRKRHSRPTSPMTESHSSTRRGRIIDVGHSTDVDTAHQEPISESQDGQCLERGSWLLSRSESSAGSESGNGYESNESENSMFDSPRNELVARLMDEICSWFFSWSSSCLRSHGEPQQSATGSSFSSTRRPVDSTGVNDSGPSGNYRKRGREDDENTEDEDDGRQKRPPTQASSDDPVANIRCFACPFHKFDPSTYSNRNEDSRLARKYRPCGGPGWRTVGKMKEHLYRSHQTPIHCPRCWTDMKTEAALGEHARATSQCNISPQPLKWIPREVLEKLKNRKRAFAGQTDEGTWRYIYGLLFPDTEIPSPYYNDEPELDGTSKAGSPTSHIMVAILVAIFKYAQAHLPGILEKIIEEALESTDAQQMKPIEKDLRRVVDAMERDFLSRLFQGFWQHWSSNQESAGLDPELVPSFYVEPLLSTDETIFEGPSQTPTSGLVAVPTQTDIRFANENPLLDQDNFHIFGDWIPQDAQKSFDDTTKADMNWSISGEVVQNDWELALPP